MPLSEDLLSDEIHPIDIVETLAQHHAWEFDRVGDDQIAMAVEGQWRSYSLTLAWSGRDETLRLILHLRDGATRGADGRALRSSQSCQ